MSKPKNSGRNFLRIGIFATILFKRVLKAFVMTEHQQSALGIVRISRMKEW